MAKDWIKGAIGKRGGLHDCLGVPQGQKIPRSKIDAAASGSGQCAKRARLAQTLAKLRG